MTPFLEKIADRLLQKFPDNMENVAIVLPSKRAVVFFKHYLSKKIDKPIFLPDFYSIEEFIENLSELQVLDNISLQFRLYATYLKFPPKKKDSFDDFLKWSNVLLHDFNEIDRNLVDPKSIYTNLTQVKELESWSVQDWSFSEENLTTMQNDYLSFFEGMLKWYNDFSHSLLEENLAYQGLAYKQAAQKIRSLEIKWQKVWFVGLNALTKSEQSIVDYLKKENIARVFWDADKFYYENPLHEAGGFLREQREKWSEIDFKGVGDYYKEKKESFNVIACPKNISQSKVAAEVIKSLSKDDLEDSKTAIVLADEALLYPVLHNLPSEVKQLNITMGSPLKNTILFAFVEALFNMHIHAIKYKRNALYYKDVITLIEHPYFVKLANGKEIEAFKKIIIQKNIVFISKSNIKNTFTNDFIIELLTIWVSNNDSIKVLNKLVEQLKKYLVGKSATVESEVLTTFFKSITILDKLLDDNDFVLELKTLQIIMQQLVSKETIPFKGEPLKGVQLMGILESRTLDFENVIMLSVNEGKLPKGKSVNSFIPYDMKKYFKLPTYAESDAVFSYHFYRLLQRANNISLIYNSETDDFGSGEKSRFITQLLAEYNGKIEEYVYKGADLEVQHSNQIVIKNSGLESKIKSWREKGVSPSALNKYNNCSLQFYYHYLAKIRVDSEVDEYADASTMGTAIHDALDTNYPIGVITERDVTNITNAILTDIEDNFVKILSEQGMREGKNYLSLQIAHKLTKNFLKLEKQLIVEANKKNQQIKIIEKEADLSSDLLVDGVNFKLSGKADRVDFEGDTLRIIDYKTGKVEQSEIVFTEFDELIDDPKKSKAFQLLMYAYLYLKMHPNYIGLNVVAGNFSFKNLKTGLLKVSKKINSKQTEVLKITQTVLDEFEAQLEIVLIRINNNAFTQTSEVKNCEWCNYKSICKR
jgi:ATP-dependent helicase/nuclease subunit B